MTISHQLSDFMWHKEDNSLSVELSTLDKGGSKKVFHKVYSDSYDSAFYVIGKNRYYEFIVEDETESVIIMKPIDNRCKINKILVL